MHREEVRCEQNRKKGGTPQNKLPYFDAVILVGLIIWPSSLGATHDHGLVHEVVIGPGAKAELRHTVPLGPIHGSQHLIFREAFNRESYLFEIDIRPFWREGVEHACK